MNKEKQRIAIATACGWTDIKLRDCSHSDYRDYDWTGFPDIHGWDRLPDYPNDLNAMHEAEKMLDTTNGGPRSGDCLRYAYSHTLYKITPEWIQPFRATAAQRAEAFLKTIGKWEDEET